MESDPVLREASRCGIPAVAIRVVGDVVDEDFPFDFTTAIDGDGRLRSSVVLRAALARPWQWPTLVRFGLAQQRALRKLGDFLDRFVVALVDRDHDRSGRL
jgi:hypothetical protein